MKVLGLATCFNRKEKTINAINRLIQGNQTIEFFFLITDDNSTDGTSAALQNYENVQVLSGNGSLFYSGGMRMVIDSALNLQEQFDFCLLFNDDVDFFDRAIELLVNRAKKKTCIWVGPTADDNGNLSYGGICKKSKFRPSVEIVKGSSEDGRICDTFNANCVLIPWDIFIQLDNIDECYSHSMGDFDYGFFASRRGFEIRVSDQYVGICCDNPTQGGWRDTSLPRQRRLELKESPKGLPAGEWFHYLNKNYGFLTALIYSLVPYIKIALKI